MNNTKIELEPFMVIEQQLLSQIKKYLDHEITREEYAVLSESYYSENESLIKDTQFDEAFTKSVPDACLFYIDEPGGSEEEKEKSFYSIMSQVYEELHEIVDRRTRHDFIFVYDYDKKKKTASRMYQCKNALMYRYNPKSDSWDMDAEQYCIYVGEDVFYDKITEEEAREITVMI